MYIEREIHKCISLSLSLSLYICIYIYVYTYCSPKASSSVPDLSKLGKRRCAIINNSEEPCKIIINSNNDNIIMKND